MLTKTCRKCNIEKELSEFHKAPRYKFGVTSWCKKCLYEHQQRPDLKEKRKLLIKAWNLAHREYLNQKSRERYAKLPKKVREKKNREKLAWHHAHKEHLSEYNKEYYRRKGVKEKKNKQKIESVKRRLYKDKSFTEKQRQWNRTRSRRRRARLSQVLPDYNSSDWITLCEKYNHRCLFCKEQFPLEKLQTDHIIPLSRGGTDTLNNVQPLCPKCNKQKGIIAIDYRIR